MKTGFAFLILLLCTLNAQGMSDAPDRCPTSIESHKSPKVFSKTELLIKACKCPTATPSLIGFVLDEGGDVNEPVGSTTALLTTIETQSDNDHEILLMLIAQATAQHRIVALKHAIEKEKWNTVALLQDRYGVVLGDDDIQQNHTTIALLQDDNGIVLSDQDVQETHAFVLAPAFAWAKRKAIAAKTSFSNAINNLKRHAHDGDDNNDSDEEDKDTADITYTVYGPGKPFTEASMNIATLGGMPE